jgi:hypothetical protein
MTDPNPIYTELLAEREAVDVIESDEETQQDER